MSQPYVHVNEIDGALGTLPAGQQITAFVGPADSGTADLPAAFARSKDVVAYLVGGPLCEVAAAYIEKYQRPCVVVPTGKTVAGLPGTAVFTGTGTSVVTTDGVPNDDYEVIFRVVAGGTLGVAGITFDYSLDGGNNYSAVIALGTALTYDFPSAGTFNLDFAAGTLVAGDKVTCRTAAPCWNGTELGTALAGLIASTIDWREVHVVGPIDATAFDAIETKMGTLDSAGRPKAWIGNTRTPNLGESEAAYLAALATIFTTKATKYGMLCAGACDHTSGVSGRKYRRPASWPIGHIQASVKEHINVADVNLNTLPGVSIRDANGNPDHHDETLNPGLDDARFTVLRTWEGLAGVFVNRPRLLSTLGSDFYIMPYRLVMNRARVAARLYLIRRLNKPLLVSKTTGFILETEALEIEAGIDRAIADAIMAEPMASGGGFPGGKFASLSRTDNILSTKKLTGQGRIIPLAYPEFIDFDLGFSSPALQVQAV